jgi:hypothetical protein
MKIRLMRKWRSFAGIYRSEPHGHDDIAAVIMAGLADQGTAVGVA